MTIRHKIAQEVAQGRGGDKWNTTPDDAETSLFIVALLKSSVPELVWRREGFHFFSGPYRLVYVEGRSYDAFYHTDFLVAGPLQMAKDFANARHVAEKTDWLTQ